MSFVLTAASLVFVGVPCCLFALFMSVTVMVPCVAEGGKVCGALSDLPEAGRAGLAVVTVLSIVFFYLLAGTALARLLRPAGWLVMSFDRLSLACYSLGPTSGILGAYFCAGSTPWSGVAKIGLRRAFGAKCLGVSFTDVASFLKSREQITDQETLKAAAWGTRWSGMLIDASALTPIIGPAMGLVLRIIGYSGMPKSSEDTDILDWNVKNWGFHLLVPVWLVPDIGRVIALLQQYRADSGEGLSSPLAKTDSIKMRLEAIENLLRERQITTKEYKKKRREIISEI